MVGLEHLPSKQYVMGLNPTRAAFSFSVKKELFRLVVLPCFYLRRSKSFHVVMFKKINVQTAQ